MGYVTPPPLHKRNNIRHSSYVGKQLGGTLNIMTVTDPRTGAVSAMPAPTTPIKRELYRAAAQSQGLTITFSKR